MSLPVPKATAKLIIAITEPHVKKAMADGDINAMTAFQSIITTINLALETDAPIEFR